MLHPVSTPTYAPPTANTQVTLCNAYSTFCENEGNRYEFKGWQMQYRDTGLISDSEMDREVYSHKVCAFQEQRCTPHPG